MTRNSTLASEKTIFLINISIHFSLSLYVQQWIYFTFSCSSLVALFYLHCLVHLEFFSHSVLFFFVICCCCWCFFLSLLIHLRYWWNEKKIEKNLLLLLLLFFFLLLANDTRFKYIRIKPLCEGHRSSISFILIRIRLLSSQSLWIWLCKNKSVKI